MVGILRRFNAILWASPESLLTNYFMPHLVSACASVWLCYCLFNEREELMTDKDKQAKKALIDAMAAIYQAIHDLGGVPSGHLYARLMDKMTLDQYNKLIAFMKDANLISESNHFLTAKKVF
jgi:hypothetical protein